jgi:predicted NUDIX family NTP pyrophosphohydrolase
VPRRSAGLLPFRIRSTGLELFLVHPGGPFWARRDEGAWSIVKGEHEEGEDPLAAARREFAEETGFAPGGRALIELGDIRQPGGKWVRAWADEADHEPERLRSNLFSMEWPRGSGRFQRFPEVDRAAWFTVDDARTKLLKGQLPFIDRLIEAIRSRTVPGP